MGYTKCYNRILTTGVNHLSKYMFYNKHENRDLYKVMAEPINKPYIPCLWGSSLNLVSENMPNEYYSDESISTISFYPLPMDKSIFSSDWLDWVKCNRFDIHKYSYGVSYLLKNSAKVVEINSLSDYLMLLQRYPKVLNDTENMNIEDIKKNFKKAINIKPDLSYSPIYIELDFEAMQKDFDAFHLTKRGFLKLRSMYPYERRFGQFKICDFYSYDCESWIIFDYDCIDQSSIWVHDNLYDTEYYKD